MLYLLDIVGTLVFAVSGAFRGLRHGLDILGVLVLAVATGVGGGIIRDVLLGATPPAAFHNELYLAVCLLGGILTMLAAPHIQRRWNVILTADAIGLGVFAALGAAKSVAFGLGPIGVLMLSAMTAVGGGVVRDMLVNEVPAVIRHDFYASAAIAGGAALLLARQFGANDFTQICAAMLVCTSLRFLAMAGKISLGKPRGLKDDGRKI